jgi:multiple sugar transport system permease protein
VEGTVRRQTPQLTALRYVLLILISLVFLLPMIWMVSGSLKSNSQIFQFPPPLLPIPPHWSNYHRAVTYIDFFTYARNSAVVSFFCVVGTLISCSLAAYAFAILRWPGRDLIFYLVLSTILLPFQVVMVPLYTVFKTFGWLGTLLPLTVPPFFASFITESFSASLAIFLLRQFFLTLPREMFDAARIDGANEFRVFWNVVLPLSRSGLITVALFSFLSSWTMFVGPLIFLNQNSLFTLPIGLQQYQSLHFTAWNYLMVAAFLFTLPILVLFLVAQRYFIQGIAFSGMKE